MAPKKKASIIVVHTARRYYRLDGLVRSLDCEAIAAM